MIVPKQGRGRPTKAATELYQQQLKKFASSMIKLTSRLDFKVSSRGWCYVLENEGQIKKSEFDIVQRLINDCRKSGVLPIDICAEDGARIYNHIQSIDNANNSKYLDDLNTRIYQTLNTYTPYSFWDDKKVYIQMLVEKIDLKSLFNPICEKYHVPIANCKGWSDINMRYDLMTRYKEYEAAGCQCYLLYCGDHDPSGLLISDTVRNNLSDISGAADWKPKHLIINRFGLNYDFIIDNNLSWIDGLETGSKKKINDLADPRHPDHNKPYVQDYISQFGARKVEANALVIKPVEGRQLCEQAILNILQDDDAISKYNDDMNKIRKTIIKQYESK